MLSFCFKCFDGQLAEAARKYTHIYCCFSKMYKNKVLVEGDGTFFVQGGDSVETQALVKATLYLLVIMHHLSETEFVSL